MCPLVFSDPSLAHAAPPGGSSAIPTPGGDQRVKLPDTGIRRRTSQFSLIIFITLITGCLIFTGVNLLDRVDRNRQVQVAVRTVEAHANLLNGL